ncbi:hypothetical protein HMPREF9120_02671 [Neisseria sp. oral taxon 020 str. F0370]|nr:hypothetical protein HMPREF9120_02671 [Neisseria sp. oral taxon 020 str. F0370]
MAVWLNVCEEKARIVKQGRLKTEFLFSDGLFVTNGNDGISLKARRCFQTASAAWAMW